ncbi:MAG: M48 family metalloprotease [Gammaproteobacteria bacterium]|nr:M48 family metalloprotease [Gammaproteobacteria bacterium]
MRYFYILISMLVSCSLQSEIALPDLGRPATAVLSQQEAEKIGASVYRQLQQQQLLFEDAVVTAYLQKLGQRLLQSSPYERQNAQRFTFFIVNDATINAFALPGGYIGIHTGLITACKNESELASVIAHEIAHITQDHLQRRLDAASSNQLPLTAAIIAAIVTGRGEVSEAVIASAMARNVQQALQFSRDNEREADSVGIKILAAAGLEPGAMAHFFQQLSSQSRLYGTIDGSSYNFLQTHPVTTDRIADAQGRATLLKQEGSQSNIKRNDDEAFAIALIRTTLASGTTTAVKLNLFTEESRPGRYARALLQQQQRAFSEALSLITTVVEEKPHEVAYLLLYSELLQQQGNRQQAISLLQQELTLAPHQFELGMALADHFIDLPDLAKAKTLVTTLQRHHPDNLALLQKLAQIEGLSNNPAAANLATAEALILQGDLFSAYRHLLVAQRQAANDFYLASRIEAKISLLKSSKEISER